MKVGCKSSIKLKRNDKEIEPCNIINQSDYKAHQLSAELMIINNVRLVTTNLEQVMSAAEHDRLFAGSL